MYQENTGELVRNKKNIVWINTARAIAMIMIYWIHCEAYWGFHLFRFSAFFAPLYVSVFFFISGYLFFGKHLSDDTSSLTYVDYLQVIRKQVKDILFKLVIPSILFSIIEFMPASLLQQRTISVGSLLIKTLGGGTYWFTSALVVAELLICVLLLTRVKSIWFYFVSCMFVTLAGMYLSYTEFTIFAFSDVFPWMYKQGMLSVCFFALGGVYRKKEQIIRKATDNNVVLLIMSVFYICLISLNTGVFSTSISNLNLNIAGILLSTWGIVVFISICQRISGKKIIQMIGKNTLGLYFVCGAVPKVLCKILEIILPQKTFVGWAVLLLGSFSLAVAIVYTIDRFIPCAFDLRVLKRKTRIQ